MVRTAFFLLLVVNAGVAAAQQAELGRLFTTPAERIAIDRARNGVSGMADARWPDARRAEAPSTARHRVSGVVQRADGTGVVWINGSAVATGQTVNGVTALANGEVSGGVALLQSGHRKPVRLKPGEAWDAVTGEVFDLLNVAVSEAHVESGDPP